MPNKDLLIALLLDDSPSMSADRAFYAATISGFNEYRQSLINDNPGDNAYMGLWTFSGRRTLRTVYDPRPVADTPTINEDTYRGSGNGTALFDAIVEMHDEIDKWVAVHELQGRTPNVLFVIYTDGENNQGNTSYQQAMEKNQAAEKDKGWQIVYMGVGADEYARTSHLKQAQASGVRHLNSATHAQSAAGATASWSQLRGSTTNYRTAAVSGQSVTADSYNFFEEDENPADVAKAFEDGEKGVTAPLTRGTPE